MGSLLQRLRDLNPLIKEVLQISGAAGASLGVLHNGKVLFTDNFGYRDVEAKVAPDEHTSYYIASVSKAMAAMGLGILVEQGKLAWQDPVIKALPEFVHQDEAIRDEVTWVDLLSHRSGLASKMGLWMGEESRVLVKPEDFIKTTTYLEPYAPFRSEFSSNNWLYGIPGLAIEQLSGKSFSDFFDDNLFKPLGLKDTFVARRPSENAALPYMWSDSGPRRVPEPPIEVGGIYEGAVGVKSSVSDLLTFYHAFMTAANDQAGNNRTSTDQNPFVQVPALIHPEIPITTVRDGSASTSYTLGWARSGLPTAVDGTCMNRSLVKKMPLIGQGHEDSETYVLYHSGSLCGYLASAILMPKNNTAIVALVNTLAKSDTADWIGKMLLETILSPDEKALQHDYGALAREAAQTKMAGFPNMHKQMAKDRVSNTTAKPLSSFVGKYFNVVDTFHVEIFQEGDSLYMCRNDAAQTYKWKLRHYQYDTWSWAIEYEDAIDRALWPTTDKDWYLYEFRSSKGGNVIDELVWRHDGDVPSGEILQKRDVTQVNEVGGRSDVKAEL